MSTPPLIAFAHVGKSFDDGRVRAVDNVSLEVAAGEFLAIVGGSGSGKTTLLRLANRLIEADSGTITIAGADGRGGEPVQLRRRAGRRVARSGAARPRPASRPPARGAVGRPTTTRRRGARARGQAAHRADG